MGTARSAQPEDAPDLRAGSGDYELHLVRYSWWWARLLRPIFARPSAWRAPDLVSGRCHANLGRFAPHRCVQAFELIMFNH